jgi:hypothetical protein
MRDIPKKRKTFWLIVTIIATLGLFSLLLFQFVLAEEKSAKGSCEDHELIALRTMLVEVPTENVQARTLIEGNIEIFEKMAAICETITPATINPNEVHQFVQWTPLPFETGIFEGQTGEIHSFEAKIENHWKGIVNGNYAIVFAGALANDPSQGLIIIRITSPDTRTTVGNRYLSPTKLGTLRIMEAKGNVLIIQPTAGGRLYFNILAQRYVSSLTDNPPTINPFLTNTSTPVSQPYP